MQPVGDGWCQQPQHGYAHALTLQHQVRLHVWLARLRVDDVGSEDRTMEVFQPFVIDGVARLHIMIAEQLCIIFQIVDDLCCYIGRIGLHEVRIVAGGLSLQDVAIVQQYQVLAKHFALLINISTDTSHCAPHGLALYEVIGKEGTVHVGSLNQPQGDSLCCLCHECCHAQQ